MILKYIYFLVNESAADSHSGFIDENTSHEPSSLFQHSVLGN